MKLTKVKSVIDNGMKLIPAAFCLVAVGLLTGCGEQAKELPTVKLSIWADERMIPLIQEGIDEFQELHKDEVILECTISEEGEDTCRDTILSDPEHAADIFSFADDQFDDLYNNGILQEISEDADAVVSESGGADSTVCKLVTKDGKLYAYPQTAGNGYYLYYNRRYYNDSDVASLDSILDIAAKNNKKFTMEYGNGWYLYSFFKGAGLELSINDEGTANVCNWNAKDTRYTGVDVAQAMLDIAKNPGFVTLTDDEFVKGVQDGEIIAGINGPWNSSYIEEAWGEDYAATKLPAYTVSGDRVQMASFTGYKLMGVSAMSDNPDWSMKLARLLTSKEYQLKRFKLLGECPVNVEAAESEEVQSDPAVAALGAQAPYASIQRIASPYWDASAMFGVTIAGGNSGDRNLQELLDEMVEAITADAQ
ncbi:MAG: extracellular solute-binding protein [Lachnospiraceae bacterium]|nr:extracellular solute-binding protein [Lachnospiraceae bacterium]